jgi:dolichol-phosphate mannosyltransferase
LKLSIIIPAHNEAGSIKETVTTLFQKLSHVEIEHEILVINDNSDDDTLEVLKALKITINTLTVYNNNGPNGFGYAVRYGLEHFRGEYVAIMMADLSDSPDDLIKFYYKILEGYDCVFGNRWIKGGKVIGYPRIKRIINFLANFIVQKTFRLKYNDCTNAFKLYSRETIEGLKPFLAPHFNLTLELPLKAIVRGYSYAILPNSWTNRKYGESKLKIKEMGSRYFFILLYCLIEKYFSKGDFKKMRRIENIKLREKQLNL